MNNEYGDPGGFDPRVKEVLDIAVKKIPGLADALRKPASRAAIQGTVHTILLGIGQEERTQFFEALESPLGQQFIDAAGGDLRQLYDKNMGLAAAENDLFDQLARDVTSDSSLGFMLGLSGIQDVPGVLKQLREITAKICNPKQMEPKPTLS